VKPGAKEKTSTAIWAREASAANFLKKGSSGTRDRGSASVPQVVALASRARTRPAPAEGGAAWNSSSLPPTWDMAMKAAWRAGPVAVSPGAPPPAEKAPGSASSSASTTARESARFTSRSSGRGAKGSATSGTTTIWGWAAPARRL
jgi:hypothetical protein